VTLVGLVFTFSGSGSPSRRRLYGEGVGGSFVGRRRGPGTLLFGRRKYPSFGPNPENGTVRGFFPGFSPPGFSPRLNPPVKPRNLPKPKRPGTVGFTRNRWGFKPVNGLGYRKRFTVSSDGTLPVFRVKLPFSRFPGNPDPGFP
jgi:Mu-like prophage protein